MNTQDIAALLGICMTGTGAGLAAGLGAGLIVGGALLLAVVCIDRWIQGATK